MSKVFTTPKGTNLPLTNLKGKDYLMVAYRIQWMNEEVPSFDIHTEFLLLTDEQTVARATIVVADKDGRVIKKAVATKRETKKDFSDHTEKAETSAIGRALAMLGYGTQFAIADLDEGERLADSPLAEVRSDAPAEAAAPAVKKSSFKKAPKKEEAPAPVVEAAPAAPAAATASGWE